MKRLLLGLGCMTAFLSLAAASCRESTCEKLIAVTTTCLSRYCSAGGASTAACTCWSNDMVLSGWTSSPCNDSQDNDGDGFTDCADPDCWASEACMCDDGEDNDDDDLADCDDPDCAFSPDCCGIREKAVRCCFDGKDNDGDGLADCEADPDCARAADCCEDGEDNDGDGLADCDDPDCATHPLCCGDQTDLEACNCVDGEDNDGNGKTDCLDEACWGLPECWDRLNGWHSEKIPYCVDAAEAMDQGCHKSRAKELLGTFDCEATTLRYSAGLMGKYKVASNGMTVDLGRDGTVDEETGLDSALVRGPDRSDNEVSLSTITFFDDGWFASNISSGVWLIRTSSGTPTGILSVAFLADACLVTPTLCDPTRPSSWRRGPEGPMFYDFLLLPEASSIVLGLLEITDVDQDGVDDTVLRFVRLQRQ